MRRSGGQRPALLSDSGLRGGQLLRLRPCVYGKRSVGVFPHSGRIYRPRVCNAGGDVYTAQEPALAGTASGPAAAWEQRARHEAYTLRLHGYKALRAVVQPPLQQARCSSRTRRFSEASAMCWSSQMIPTGGSTTSASPPSVSPAKKRAPAKGRGACLSANFDCVSNHFVGADASVRLWKVANLPGISVKNGFFRGRTGSSAPTGIPEISPAVHRGRCLEILRRNGVSQSSAYVLGTGVMTGLPSAPRRTVIPPA